MSKKMEISTALHLIKKKKAPMKRSRKNKNQLFKKVLDYLKSDYFMFAPLDSSQLSDSSVSTGSASIQEETEKSRSANTLDGGSERVGEPGRKISIVIRKVQNTDSVLPTMNAVVRCTRVRTEMVMVYQNC